MEISDNAARDCVNKNSVEGFQQNFNLYFTLGFLNINITFLLSKCCCFFHGFSITKS